MQYYMMQGGANQSELFNMESNANENSVIALKSRGVEVSMIEYEACINEEECADHILILCPSLVR